MQDFAMDENSFQIEMPWAVGGMKLDQSGEKLVVVSQDTKYIYVYSTLNFKNND